MTNNANDREWYELDAPWDNLREIDGKLNTRAEQTCEWVLREKWPNRTDDDYVYSY